MNYEEIIINEYVEQFKIYMKSEKDLIEMFESENVNEDWIQNYHIYDPTWINSWKKIISFKELIKESIKDEKKIFEIIKKSLNSGNLFNLKLDNKSIYTKNGDQYLINPMKPFDLISDEVWKLFSKNTNNKNCEGKISLLKGNKKIIIRLDEYCYSVRFLSKKNSSNKKCINEYNEFIIAFNSKSEKERDIIIKEIANSKNIDDWMKNNGFKFNAKQFTIKKDDIIKQKYNNWNFTCIKKYEETSNISAVMRALSTIEPLTDYFMNNINDKKKFDEQTTIFLNSFKEYFIKLWSNEEEKFTPKELCENFRNLKGKDNCNIKKEQDPFEFLRLILKYLNEKLNQKDKNLNFDFNNIRQKLNKLSKKQEDFLDKIIKKSNSIIGKLFYGLMIERCECEHCKKIIIENIKKFDIIDVNYKSMVEKIQKDGSISIYNLKINEIDFFIEEDLNPNKVIVNENQLTKMCNTCKKEAIFKKEILSYPPFLLIRLNRGNFEENKGFINNVDFQNNKIEYDNIKFMNNILSDIIKSQNENNRNIEYELISMVNYMKIKDNNNNEEQVEFINLSKSPYLIEDGIWYSFICNRKPVELRNSSYDNDISLPCILFYKLKEDKS